MKWQWISGEGARPSRRASALERAEVERRLNVYLEQLPEYQDRISLYSNASDLQRLISVDIARCIWQRTSALSIFNEQRPCLLRQSSFWDNSYKKAAGSALKKVIRYVTIIGYPFVCSFAGDDIIELDSTTDEIKMPPFRMASF